MELETLYLTKEMTAAIFENVGTQLEDKSAAAIE